MSRDKISELERLLRQRRSCRRFDDRPLSIDALERLLFAAQGCTSCDGKRTAPSAHALFPLKTFVIARRVEGLEPGLYETETIHKEIWQRLHGIHPGALLPASLADDIWLEDSPAVIVVAADRQIAIDHFADQQPDGLRGVRYIDFEAGAAIQNLYLSAIEQELGGVVVMGYDDDLMQAALRLPTPFQSIALFCVGHPAASR
ncbi:nitroreductase family protein [Salinicola peritrichatus]|uniref:nitroreductase family protein n=1 Tax=Salinicola peritrichatus TaxID=1267424 RepID=UPI000DA1422A|nr:SagB/ThcOx family dehydrogenase [Salinicola peritrichatus]